MVRRRRLAFFAGIGVMVLRIGMGDLAGYFPVFRIGVRKLTARQKKNGEDPKGPEMAERQRH